MEEYSKFVDVNKSSVPLSNLRFYCNNWNCFQQEISVMLMKGNEFFCPLCKECSIDITVYDSKVVEDKSSGYWRLMKK